MTVKKLIEKLNKFNPDGNKEVVAHFMDSDPDVFEEICSIALEEDTDGKLMVVLRTTDVI